MRNKKYIIGILMLVSLLLLVPTSLGATFSFTENFGGYNTATTPAAGTTKHVGYTITNLKVSTIACYAAGHGDSKCLIIGGGTKGQNFSAVINFNQTGSAYTSVSYVIQPQNIGSANSITIALNSIGNTVVIQNITGNYTRFTVKTGSTTIRPAINAGTWYYLNYTFNWTTNKVRINCSSNSSGWLNFANTNGYRLIRNCWGTFNRVYYTYNRIIGLTIYGTRDIPCDFYIDDIRWSATYTPSWSVKNVLPYNNGAYVTKPRCQLTISRTNAVFTNVSLYEWKNSAWILKYSASTMASSITPYFTFNNASLYQHTYYWKVVIEDHKVYYNATYRFTTWNQAIIRMLLGRLP